MRRGEPIAQPAPEPTIDVDDDLVELDEPPRPSGDPLEDAISLEELDELESGRRSDERSPFVHGAAGSRSGRMR